MGTGLEIGVDVGGTFTDVVCRRAGSPLISLKVPSTRTDPSAAVLSGVGELLVSTDLKPQDVSRFVHGTTVAVNAVIERKGARIGIITTKGFKDTLEIGRSLRHQIYEVILEPEVPQFLAPGARRKEAAERISARGEILTPLDETSAASAIRELVEDGVTAVAVCLLFSFMNHCHENQVRDIIRRLYPEVMVSVSHEVDPAFREYERTVITAFDAYLKPVVNRYLERLEVGLKEIGIEAPLEIMQSRGGTARAAVAAERPVRLFLSGPAAGVVGARIVGTASEDHDLITVDIGGTSCDIALISRAKPVIRSVGEIGGFPVRVPMVDVNAIGAGGGSIAWLDGAAGLRVGPHSAGSDPGPACYGRGGEEPTVTDASVVLQFINPAYFAGGRFRLDPERARKAIMDTIAQPMGLTLEAAAQGIHHVLNAQMAEGIRLVSIRRGFDPRQFTLLPLGGGGSVHATALAQELSIDRIVVPRHPGVLSAVGLLAASVEHEVSAAFPVALSDVSADALHNELVALDREAARLMQGEAVDQFKITISHFADICYVGQSYHLEVPVHLSDPAVIARMYEDFLSAHDQVYGHNTRAAAKIVNLRAVHQVPGDEAFALGSSDHAEGNGQSGCRPVLWLGHQESIETAIYDRHSLAVGETIKGPAIIEQADTTVLVEPHWSCRLEESQNLVIFREGSYLNA